MKIPKRGWLSFRKIMEEAKKRVGYYESDMEDADWEIYLPTGSLVEIEQSIYEKGVFKRIAETHLVGNIGVSSTMGCGCCSLSLKDKPLYAWHPYISGFKSPYIQFSLLRKGQWFHAHYGDPEVKVSDFKLRVREIK